ncbi:hypothetical protein GCM10010495_82520 [Kitasatospora herbaricolor]|nr:hypothetical protein GCM10010495_82520 [Kitasatospora herbaricolor]
MVLLHLDIQELQVDVLLDSGAFVCFIDEEFVKFYNIFFVKKLKSVYVEVIDG